ncbi:MAG: hypothetical protein EZS28_044068, partial [Streblomastix strix]
VHAQAAREALVLNERGKFLKATTPPPGVIRQSVMKELNKRNSSAQALFTGGGGRSWTPQSRNRRRGRSRNATNPRTAKFKKFQRKQEVDQ